jgi:hypothetical protein
MIFFSSKGKVRAMNEIIVNIILSDTVLLMDLPPLPASLNDSLFEAAIAESENGNFQEAANK